MQVSRRGRRTGFIVLASLMFIYVVYVVGTFLALRMGALQSLTRDQKDFGLAATGGHSFWPTHVVLRDLRFRFKDYNIEMELEADLATVRWSPLLLLSKTIEIDEFRANGVRYELLHRVKQESKNRERLAAFPDTGFQRSKVYDSPKPPYRVPPFRIRVRRVEANLREAWLLEYRAIGSFQVTGGFELHEQVEVFPSSLRVRGVRVLVGDKQLASRLDCDVSAQLDPFPGREKLTVAMGASSGRVACQGALSDLSAVGVYVAREDLLLDMAADLDAKLELDHGQLRSSTARAQVAVRRLGLPEGFLTGDLQLLLGVESSGQMTLAGDFRGTDHRTRPLGLTRAGFEVGAAQPKLVEVALEHVEAELDGLQIREPSILRRLGVGAKFPLSKIEQARLKFGYQKPTPGRDGRVELQSQGALAVFPGADRSVSCSYEAEVRCTLGENEATCPVVALECSPLSLASGSESQGRVALRLRALAFDAEGERASSEWAISLGQPREVLRALMPDSAWADLGLALAPLGPVEGRARINRRAGTIAGTIEQLRTGAFSAQAGFLFAERFVSRWRVVTPLGRFGVHQGSTGVQIKPFVAGDWDVLAFGEN